MSLVDIARACGNMLFDVKSLPAGAFVWVAPCLTCANKQEVPFLFVVSLPMLMAEGHSDGGFGTFLLVSANFYNL